MKNHRCRFLLTVLKRVLLYAAAALVVVIALFPFYWAFKTSVTSRAEMYTPTLQYWPSQPTLSNYRELIRTTPFFRYFLNSVIVSVSSTIITTLVAILAGYSLSRVRLKNSKYILYTFLVTQMVPPVIIIIPIYLILRGIGLLNTRLALILVSTTLGIPFCVWMLKGFFDSIPKELEEAAAIDGCRRFEILYRIIVPLSVPGILATALYVFIIAWNELIMAVMLTTSQGLFTLPVGLENLMGEYVVAWGPISAGGVITSLPIVVIFIFLQKYLVQGLTAGAVKG